MVSCVVNKHFAEVYTSVYVDDGKVTRQTAKVKTLLHPRYIAISTETVTTIL